MEQVINFSEAIRRVHPDSNKNITDAGDKVKTIMMYKNDPQRMFIALRKWNLLPSRFNNTTFKTEPKLKYTIITRLESNTDYTGKNVYVSIRGGMFFFKIKKTTKKRVYFEPNAYNRKFCNVNSVMSAWKKNI